MRATRGRNIRVLAFMLVGLAVFATMVVLIGEKSGLFESKATLHVHFPDVGGLVVGAPVRLAGLDIGTVEDIELSTDGPTTTAHVIMSVRRRYLDRIRADSVASVGSKGLLGDKLVEISVGGAAAAPIRDGDTLKAEAAMSLGQLADKLEDAVGAIASAADSAGEAVGKLVTEKTGEDIGRILNSVANILEEVERGDGLAHRLVYDAQLSEDVALAAKETRQTLAAARRATDRADRILATVEQGPGGAHELLYGDSASKMVADLAETSRVLRETVQAVQTGDGLAHQLLYGPEGADMLRDLGEAAAAMERMAASIERGEGTLGGLVVDPTVYEDLKTILGNVERNVLLKALVRFAIKEGDLERPATPSQPAPSEAAP